MSKIYSSVRAINTVSGDTVTANSISATNGIKNYGSLPAAPISPAPGNGDTYYNNISDIFYYYDGISWRPLSPNAITYSEILSGYPRTEVNSSPYTVMSTDYIIAVDSSGGAITINLPIITSFTSNKHMLEIVDESGTSSSNPVTVQPDVSNTINKDTNLVISSDHASISLYSDGTSNWVIY